MPQTVRFICSVRRSPTEESRIQLLKGGWITPVTCPFDVLLSPILVLVLCSMFFDPFDPLINVLILPANSLALFLVQKLRERRVGIIAWVLGLNE